MRWHDATRIRELTIELTKVPSISGTVQEREMANTIYQILKSNYYFAAHPEFLEKHSIPGDPWSREVITAFVKGTGSSHKTVVLLSHYDVVGTDDYGRFQQMAFDPETITEKLRKENPDGLAEDARLDLESGKWLFGRGVMDMKAGLALQIAMLEHYSQLEAWDGNVMLVATPDEETGSAGMFEAVAVLNRLKEKYEMDYQLCICSEANWPVFPGDHTKYLYTGSVGKLLPVVCSVGTATHVGSPLLGVNAAWMASEVVSLMELSHDFQDTVGDESAPLPTCLNLHIVKDAYNVQTPSFAYAMFNVLTMKQTPQEVLAKTKKMAVSAADRIVDRIEKSYSMANPGKDVSSMRPKVFLYQELYERGIALYGEEFADEINLEMHQLSSSQAEPREATVHLIQHVSHYFMEEAPFYVIALAPPFYPHVVLEDTGSDKLLVDMMEKVLADALMEDSDVKMMRFFPGLSDVSYARIRHAEQTMDAVRQNMPVFGHLYSLPIEEMTKLNLPTVNIGPFGKDAHQWTERLELTFSTEVAPQLLANTIAYVLNDRSE